MNCIVFTVLMTAKVCLVFSFFPFLTGVSAFSLPFAIMLWAEGCRRSAYKILLIKMQSILLNDLPSFLEMPSIYVSSSARQSGFEN